MSPTLEPCTGVLITFFCQIMTPLCIFPPQVRPPLKFVCKQKKKKKSRRRKRKSGSGDWKRTASGPGRRPCPTWRGRRDRAAAGPSVWCQTPDSPVTINHGLCYTIATSFTAVAKRTHRGGHAAVPRKATRPGHPLTHPRPGHLPISHTRQGKPTGCRAAKELNVLLVPFCKSR